MNRTTPRSRERTAAPLRILTTGAVCLAAIAFFVALFGAEADAAKSGWESKVDASVLQKAALGKTDFIVYFGRTDLSGASALATKDEKGRYVFERLTAAAKAAQPGALAELKRLGAEYQSFWIANMIYAKGGLGVVRAMAERGEVQAIYTPFKGRLMEPVAADRSTQSTRDTLATDSIFRDIDRVDADRVWAELGVTGVGAVVAGADTGVRWDHDALKSKYRGWNGTTADHNYNWHDAIPYMTPGCPTPNGDVPCDDNSHGTHTVGTMVGSAPGTNNQFGMAPDAKWIGCRNMGNTGQSLGTVPTYGECMQWLIAPTDSNNANPDPSKAPHVVNNSWGCVEGCASPALKDEIDASRAAGIFYAVSAGNDGSNCGTVAAPLAVYLSAFTVGATVTNTAGGLDTMASFSSRGPVATNPAEGALIPKPDIVAPGNNVRSATNATTSSYGNKSGTSMAGPHVAGLVALIVSANPNLAGQVDRIEEIIQSTAIAINNTQICPPGTGTTARPNNVVGYGRIDAFAAVQMALHNDAPTTLFDQVTTFVREAIEIDVVANDTDPNDDPFVVTAVGTPSKGTAEITDGKVTYTPNAGRLGLDSFTYTVTDNRGESSTGVANVTILNSNASNGGGWLLSDAGTNVNFRYRVTQTNEGLVGTLGLTDKAEGVTIEVDSVSFMGIVEPACGSISDGPRAFELHGTGTFNGEPASFRWCGLDLADPAVEGPDAFYLECTSGCPYNTGSGTPDDNMDGGNLNVRRITAESSDGGDAAPQSEPEPSTVMLDPIAAASGVAGQLQSFTVEVYDQNQEPMSNATVTLTRTTSSGTTTLTAVTGPTGAAKLALPNVSGTAEYVASAGGVDSNAIEITSLVR